MNSFKQEGYVLLTTLILLVMITILAVTQVSLNSTQTRVVANASDTEVSFEKTEGAVNEAINRLRNGTYLPSSFLSNSNGLYTYDPTVAPLWTTINWTSSAAVINSFQGGTGSQASYFIEKLPSVIQPGQNMSRPTHVYRITSRAVGASGNSAIVIQATVEVPQ